MNCHQIGCSGNAKIMETRKRKEDGLIRRRYECGKGHRFTTLEIITAIDDKPLSRGNPMKYRNQQEADIGVPN